MTPRERLVAAHRDAATFYRQQLESPAGEGPRCYLAGRRLEESLDDARWVIGYAPPGWTRLVEHLHERGYSDTEILAAGLATTSRTDHVIDRFRERIVLGIHDAAGDLVGFSGRAAPNARPEVPRYLNSPATPLFRKGELLFGLHEQSERLDSGAIPVLVEGQIDVLAVAGSTTDFVAVSTCGTTLRPEQVAALRGVARGDTIVTAYDDDPAGRTATLSAYRLLRGSFGDLRAAQLPDGHDPSSLAEADSAAMARVLRGAGPLADVLVDRSIDRFPDHRTNTEARIMAVHDTVRVIAGLLPCDIPRAVARTAERLRLDHAVVSEDLARELAGPLSVHRPLSRPGYPQPGRPALRGGSVER